MKKVLLLLAFVLMIGWAMSYGAIAYEQAITNNTDVWSVWEKQFKKWDIAKSKHSLLEYLQKSNLLPEMLELVSDEQMPLAEREALIDDLYVKKPDILLLRDGLEHAFGDLSDDELGRLLWHIVAEDDLKQVVTKIAPATIDSMTTPMNPIMLKAFVDIYLEQAEKAGMVKGKGGLGGVDKGKPKGAKDGPHNDVIGGGGEKPEGTESSGGVVTSDGEPSVSDEIACLGDDGAESSGDTDPSPEKSSTIGMSEGPGSGGKGGQGGVVYKKVIPGEENKKLWTKTYGKGGTDNPCYGQDPMQTYGSSSGGGGIGKPPQNQDPVHLQPRSYGWSVTTTSSNIGDTAGGTKTTTKTSFEPYDTVTGYNKDEGQHVDQVQGKLITTTTTTPVNHKGQPTGKPTTETKSSYETVTPQENQEKYKEAKENGKVKEGSDNPPMNSDGTEEGQKSGEFNPESSGGNACSEGNIASRAGCMSVHSGAKDPDYCVDLLKKKSAGISEVDPNSLYQGCGGSESEGLGLLPIQKLWDPVPFLMKKADTPQSKISQTKNPQAQTTQMKQAPKQDNAKGLGAGSKPPAQGGKKK